MNKEDFFLLGNISKTYGKEGALVVQIAPEFQEILEKEESVFIEIDDYLVPFFMEWMQEISNREMRLKFEDIETPEKAKDFVDKNLFLPNYLKPETEGLDFSENDIVGFQVIDEEKGKIGKVLEIVEMPKQHLLKVQAGEKEVLIPIVEEIVKDVDTVKRTIFIAAPEGLIDLYL